MKTDITEALLEHHFHSLLMERFSLLYGPILQVFKPDPRYEAWVGFDKAFVRTHLSEREFYRRLRSAAKNQLSRPRLFYVAYFLQFKKVEPMVRSRRLPPGYHTPYYRSKLKLDVDEATGLSQHETLRRIAQIENASVDYACPMIFDRSDLWYPPNSQQLRLVPLKSAPGYSDSPHYIVFQTTDDPTPLWFSEASAAESYSLDHWIFGLVGDSPQLSDGERVLETLLAAARATLDEDAPRDRSGFTRYLPQATTVIEFVSKD
ncbi:MAG: hypothetical protein HPY55_01225 [Firmicutes bacterium]|nr:hypothetical protein [Bacillota bacterium]